MRHIRRAAVTGLFAIWLAPLSAAVEAPGGAALRDRPAQAERAAVDARREQEEPRGEGETSSEA